MVQTYISTKLNKILQQIRKSKYSLAKLSTIVNEFLCDYLLKEEKLLKEVFKNVDTIKKIKEELVKLKNA